MNNFLEIKCPAKINLSLDVLNKREDGYHNLSMVMQEIKLFDEISFDFSCNGELSLTVSDRSIPTDESNLIIKAAKVFGEKTGISVSAKISLEKNIPSGAGLGGGSSDAAGTLKALNSHYGYPLSDETLFDLALTLGADVPFFLKGGCMLAEGIGEKLTPLPPLEKGFILVAKPGVFVSTAQVYKSLVLGPSIKHPDTQAVIKALKTQDIELLSRSAGNVLETVTSAEYPQIEEFKQLMLKNGASYSLMSGSGSAVFGIFKAQSDAEKALAELKKFTEQVYIV